MSILSVTDLQKHFGSLKAVDGVSFQVAEGESYGLLGPNGAGKTTTISMVCGLMKKDSGDVVVAGEPMNGSGTTAKKAIGYVPQDIALYPDMSATENLKFFGRLYGLSGRKLRQRVEAALGIVGLKERAKDRVSEYSGGMKRRLNIAAGLLHEPRLLVLDEPTVGVDPQSRNAILENVEELKAQGIAVLYTTHYMEEAERLCDRVGIIDQGKIIAEGTRRELVSSIGQRDRVELTATGDLQAFAHQAQMIDEVDEASVTEQGVGLLCKEGRRLLPRLLELAEESKVDVSSVEVFEPDLEAVFLNLTGKALRD
jgi:linearmycin/streptolysin S transport system ATP-binding protein